MNINYAEYIISCVKKEQYPNKTCPEFILLGRSNVGKSSFINAVTNRKKLAYTSSKPGKTLTLNFYDINHSFFLVDVPGYGYAARTIGHRLDFGDMIEEYLKSSTLLRRCFLIVDSRHEPTEDDVLMYNYLKHYENVVTVIATKCDKLTKNEMSKVKKTIVSKLEVDEDDIILFSSLTKLGVEEVHKLIEREL